MRPHSRAPESALPKTVDPWVGPGLKLLPGDEQARSAKEELGGRELIARQRALVQDIKDVVSLTRKIIDSTREQLEALNLLNRNSLPAAARESHSSSEAESPTRRW